jgi:uncharacterized protein
MSTKYVDVIRAGFAAFARGDVEFLLAQTDPEIEIVDAPEFPGARTYRGHDGLRSAIEAWAGQWDDFRVEVERVIDAGRDRVIVIARHHGRGKSSGVPVATRNANLFTGRDGNTVRWEMFSSLDDAFAAIGLRKLTGEDRLG